jgi:hypothetical protein
MTIGHPGPGRESLTAIQERPLAPYIDISTGDRSFRLPPPTPQFRHWSHVVAMVHAVAGTAPACLSPQSVRSLNNVAIPRSRTRRHVRTHVEQCRSTREQTGHFPCRIIIPAPSGRRITDPSFARDNHLSDHATTLPARARARVKLEAIPSSSCISARKCTRRECDDEGSATSQLPRRVLQAADIEAGEMPPASPRNPIEIRLM